MPKIAIQILMNIYLVIFEYLEIPVELFQQIQNKQKHIPKHASACLWCKRKNTGGKNRYVHMYKIYVL